MPFTSFPVIFLYDIIFILELRRLYIVRIDLQSSSRYVLGLLNGTTVMMLFTYYSLDSLTATSFTVVES